MMRDGEPADGNIYGETEAVLALAKKLLGPIARTSLSRYPDRSGADEVQGHADTASTVSTSEAEDGGDRMPRSVDLGAQFRKAIQRTGLTRNQIAKQADLSYAVVHGFMAGTKDLQLMTASKIATLIGVEFSQTKRTGKRSTKSG